LEAKVGEIGFEFLVVEYWDVPDENIPKFMAYYESVIYRTFAECDGYAGMTVLRRPEGATPYGAIGPRKAIAYHTGMTTMGVRTDAMIDFDALLQNEYNIVGLQFWSKKPDLPNLLPVWTAGWERQQPNWREENPGLDDPWDVMIKDFFALVRNHWDVFFDVTVNKWLPGVLGAGVAAARAS
jgi:hypothetical protein